MSADVGWQSCADQAQPGTMHVLIDKQPASQWEITKVTFRSTTQSDYITKDHIELTKRQCAMQGMNVTS